MRSKERRTENSRLSTRGYKGPKILPYLFGSGPPPEAARGFSGGLGAIKRIIQDIQSDDENE
jgi:hypothetical protein